MKKPSGLSAEDRFFFPWGAVSHSVGVKGNSWNENPSKNEATSGKLNGVEPVKGQGELGEGNASARRKHWQRESEHKGRDEPFRQARLCAGEPKHPCAVREELCLLSSCLCLASSSMAMDANRQQLSQHKPTHGSWHYAQARCTPASGPQSRAGRGMGWMEEVGENWAGTGAGLSLTCALSAPYVWCSWRSSFLELKYLFTSSLVSFSFFFPFYFLGKIICQGIGRTVFGSSFVSNVVTPTYLEQLCTRCLERECAEKHFEMVRLEGKSQTAALHQSVIAGESPLRWYILPFVLIIFLGKQHFVYPAFSAFH